MRRNKLQRFASLYWREIRAARTRALVFAGLLVLWLLLFTSGLISHPGQAMIEANLGILTALPFWAGAVALWGLRGEWRARTSELLLSLPVPSWQILLSKLLAVMTEVTAYSIGGLAASLLFLRRSALLALAELPPGYWPGLAVPQALKLYVTYWLAIAGMVALLQFAFVVGRLVPRFSVLLSAMALVGGGWLVLALGTFTTWLLDLNHRGIHAAFVTWRPVNDAFQYVHLEANITPILVAIAMAVAFFLASAYLLDHQVDA